MPTAIAWAFVDDAGAALTADETTWILLQSFGKELSDKPFVCDVKSSRDRVREAAEKFGAKNPGGRNRAGPRSIAG